MGIQIPSLLFGTGRPLAALLLASAVIMGSPGPSTLSVTAVGASFGVRRSLNYAGGLVAGTTIVLGMVAVGMVALVLAVPYGAQALGAVSTIYILYLAFRIATAPPLARQNPSVTAPGFAGGFLLAVANPKAYLAIAAVFAGTTLLPGHRTLDALVKTLLLTGMIVLIHLTWLLAGSFMSRLLHDPVSAHVINGMMAAGLVFLTLVPYFR